jgi:cytochrome c biogenesis protein CcmG/thiol:disulfide interchange protein DsbE
MARISPLVALPPLVFAGLAVFFWLGMNREDPDQLPSARQGETVPALTVNALDSYPPLAPDMLTAPGVKLVNFFASWCAPCRAEHPNLEALARQGVTIYGVNYKDKDADALTFLKDMGNPYAAIGADSTGRTGIDWGLYGVPETFVVDGRGTILLRFPGPLTEEVIATKIRPAMAAARP